MFGLGWLGGSSGLARLRSVGNPRYPAEVDERGA